MYNRVILIGRIATEVVRRYTPSGTAVVNFRLAVNRPVVGPDGKDADFFTIVAWRELAERIASMGEKGRLVCVEGKLRERSWVGTDGMRRRSVEIYADALRFLDKPQQVIPPEEIIEEEPLEEGLDDNLHIVKEEDIDPFGETTL